MDEQKKVGIVCDNYKVRRFKRLLKANEFEYQIKEFTKSTTAFFIQTTESRIKEISKICKKIEIDFKRSN